MSKSESEKLVAVMLLESDAEHYRELPTEKKPDSRSNRLKLACKRALRPEPPDDYFLHLVRKLAGGPNPTDRSESEQALKWIEHVIEHGWDPSE